MRQLCKGNVAIVKGALLAGCRSYYGYPITPASEIAEAAAEYMPQVGGTFLQAESEVAAINMVYGAASAGLRVMTASSGPGISLMQEGMSYLTRLAFELADRYRNPAVVLTDGFIGQMMEPLELQALESVQPEKPWAVKGTPQTRKNLIASIYLEPDELEAHVRKLEEKYKKAAEVETRYELYRAEDPEVLLVGYGITSRVLRTVVDMMRKEGVRAGLFRPITLWPFPAEALRHAARRAQMVLVVEMSTGQMVEDVRLTLDGRVDVEF